MEIIKDINKIQLNNTCVTIGKFDGFHLGHKKLLDKMNEKSNLKKVLITFDKTPQDILCGRKGQYILNEQEKQKICIDYGIDVYISIPITKEFLNMAAQEFITDVLVKKAGAKCIVTGEDFRFGKDRSGDSRMISDYAKEYGYVAINVPKAEYNGMEIGSTRIKEAIRNGNMDDANNMLGYPYIITGKIQHGRQIGTKMGLPTANIIPDTDKVMPPNGVYKTIVVTEEGKMLNAISNIGTNPTVCENSNLRLESHILDFDEEIYGEFIEVRLLKFVRPEKKFDSIEELKHQIESDIIKCRTM